MAVELQEISPENKNNAEISRFKYEVSKYQTQVDSLESDLKQLDSNNASEQNTSRIESIKRELEVAKKNLKENSEKLESSLETQEKLLRLRTGIDIEALKKSIDSLPDNLNEKDIGNVFEKIDKEVKEPESKQFLMDLFIGKLEYFGYHVTLNNKKIIVTSIKHNGDKIDRNIFQFEFMPYDNSYITGTILKRSTKYNDYVNSKKDNTGKIDKNDIKIEEYYDLIISKYNLDKTKITIDSINNNYKIEQDDRNFIISYLQSGYKGVEVGEIVNRLVTTEQTQIRIGQDLPPEERDRFEREIGKYDNTRTPNEIASSFIKDPFKELNNIMGKAGGIGGLAIMGAIIYFMFKKPKEVFGGIAMWGLLKGVGALDLIGNTFEGQYNEDLKLGGKVAWNWLSRQYKNQNILGFGKEAYERGKMWFKFSNYQYNNSGVQKNVIDSNFVDLYNSSNSKDFEKKVIRSDGAGITPEDKKNDVSSLKSEINKLVYDGTNKDGGKKEIFLENIKGMTVLEVIDYITDKNKETTKQDNQSGQTVTQHQSQIQDPPAPTQAPTHLNKVQQIKQKIPKTE